jgi:hypothetical protein
MDGREQLDEPPEDMHMADRLKPGGSHSYLGAARFVVVTLSRALDGPQI